MSVAVAPLGRDLPGPGELVDRVLSRYEWEDRVSRDERVTGSLLLVALLYARRAGSDGRANSQHGALRPVWPSNLTVAREGGLSRETVNRLVRKLVSLGYLTAVDRSAFRADGRSVRELAQGDQRPKAYCLTAPASVT